VGLQKRDGLRYNEKNKWEWRNNMLRKNDLLEAKVESLTIKGEGIVRVDGFILFVPGAAAGDFLELRVTKLKKNYGYARIQRILEPSENRVIPHCPVAARCGGCVLQHISYPKQLELKTTHVRDVLQRIGGLEEAPVEPCLGMQTPWEYRNKMVFPIGRGTDGRICFGFYAQRTHRIIPLEGCPIGESEAGAVAREVVKVMEEQGMEPYDEITGKGGIRRVFVRSAYRTGEMMVVISSAGRPEPGSEILVERIRRVSSRICGILWNVNRGNNNLVLGEEDILLWGKDTLQDVLCGNRFSISAHSFYQVNPQQTQVLYEKALEFADLKGSETVFDLYCGIGTISLCAAKKAKRVIGIEIVPQAIENARANACANGIKNAEFYCGPAEKWMPELAQRYGQADVVILDPPRKGSDEVTLRAIAQVQPQRVVYVSCDPATLARDVKYLGELGYHLIKVQPCDMFPHTGHVETVVLLSKGEIDSKKVRVEFSLEDMDMSGFQNDATYGQIKERVLQQTGLKVSSLYIAQVKQKYGIIERENYNKPKSENAKQPKCPPEKEAAITEALKFFGMI
jgi:23S rRNA (uracil1939-C5)-methyltransferase